MRLIVEQLALSKGVNKELDPADRRSQLVTITDKGQSMLKQEQSIRAQWIAQLLQDLSTEEIDQIETALTTLEKLLDSASADTSS